MLTMKYWWRGRIDCKPTSDDGLFVRIGATLPPKKKDKEKEDFFKEGEFKIE